MNLTQYISFSSGWIPSSFLLLLVDLQCLQTVSFLFCVELITFIWEKVSFIQAAQTPPRPAPLPPVHLSPIAPIQLCLPVLRHTAPSEHLEQTWPPAPLCGPGT